MRLLMGVLAMALLAPVACTSDDGAGPTETASTSAAPSSSSPSPTAPSPTSPSPTTSSATSPSRRPTAAPTDRAEAIFNGMTLAQRVGQLFMVDCPSTGVTDATVTAIRQYHVGSIILDGTTTQGVQRTAAVTTQLQQLAPPSTKLFISADQEGGQVQRLQGPGFSAIPSALEQGGLAPSTLRAQATGWGRELHAAGVNVDLAPVLDTVPPDFGSNPPIGDLDRQYGFDPATVTSHGLAFINGLKAAGVDAAVKHFPGLGRVTGNTDYTAGIVDTATTRQDPYLAPFAAAIRRGVPFVMMSTAVYARIDPDNPAAFSKTIVSGMLRGDLGFTGIIVTDDVGRAAQVSTYSVADRAVQFFAAGGTMVLTVDPSQTAEMTTAVQERARLSPGFRAKVNAAALTVLRAKLARGLLR